MPFNNQLAEDIWAAKYRYVSPAGERDRDYRQTAARVATAVALAEQKKEQAHWQNKFSDALDDFKFISAGRIFAGAGTGRVVTLFNCFVMGTIPDRLDGIFTHLKEAALTMQQGGGIGMDFSTLRPKGSLVEGVGLAPNPDAFPEKWIIQIRRWAARTARVKAVYPPPWTALHTLAPLCGNV